MQHLQDLTITPFVTIPIHAYLLYSYAPIKAKMFCFSVTKGNSEESC